MIESSSEIIYFYKGRDVSPYLFHFVKGANPFQVLEQMLTKCLTHCEYDYMPDMPDYMSDYMENPEFLDHIDNEKSDEKL